MKEGTRESGVPSLERTENEEQKMPDASFCRHLFLSIPDGRDAGTGCFHRQHPYIGTFKYPAHHRHGPGHWDRVHHHHLRHL